MGQKPYSKPINRRGFLVTFGTVLAAVAASCTRLRERVAQTSLPIPTQELKPGVTPALVETAAQVETPALQPAVPTAVEFTPTFSSAVPVGTPDMILKNGKILTIDNNDTVAQALAIKEGVIQAVGKNDLISSLAGDQTKIIDAGGRTVTPGLIDPHIHFRLVGLNSSYYQPFIPPEVNSVPTLQKALAGVIKTKARGEWLMGYYLVLADKSIPTKQDLDAASSENPVFIMHIGGHWGTANSAAMKLAGITDATPSPEGGIIEKDANGKLTGVFYNHRAMDVLRRFAPPIDIETIRSSILSTQPLLAACGVTSFHDNNIREPDHIRAYQDLSKNGQLFLRNDLYLTLEWPTDINKVDEVDPYTDTVTRFAGYKFLIDGQLPTAYTHEPHPGASWDKPTWDPAIFKQIIRTLHDTGRQISVHCAGDAAVDLTIDAYEAAMNANPRSDPRHRIEHVVLSTPEATRRMKDLGIVVSTNPQFIYVGGDAWKGNFGEERMNRIMVTREWLDAGVHTTIGSDAPTTPFYTPQVTMAGAIGRFTFSKKVVGPDQALTNQEALRAHTIEAAYAGHAEKIKGSLEPGKLADIAVWDQDPLTATFEQLAKMKTVYMTLVGGKIVHQT